MAGNTFGKLFAVTTFGESHGTAIGCIVDGCPAGLLLNEEDIQKELDKRKPGQGIAGTKRTEEDKVHILSGLFEGKTTGTPIALVIYNEDQKSKDYSNIKDIFRPNHADYTYFKKYGFRDYRGGGRASARETAARVAAGAIAKKILEKSGVKINAYVKELGGISCEKFSEKDIAGVYETELRMPDKNAAKKAEQEIKKALIAHDSLGAVIEVIANGVPTGLGEPVFEKLDAQIAGAMMGIPAVKGVEIGAGFLVAKSTGSKNNDLMKVKNGKEYFLSNNSGGILGGISNGNNIVVRVAFKPTSSISQEQNVVTEDMKERKVTVVGRHDVCVGVRGTIIAESMLALVLVNALMENKNARI